MQHPILQNVLFAFQMPMGTRCLQFALRTATTVHLSKLCTGQAPFICRSG